MAFKALLSLFALKDFEIRIFEKLIQLGPLKAGDLAKQTGINRTSVYDTLYQLMDMGLVYETLQNQAKVFVAESPKKIKLLVDEKRRTLHEAEGSLKKLETLFTQNSKSFMPRMRLFEGKQELQQMMKDTLLYPNSIVYTYWPIPTIVEVLGSEFVERFNKERIKSNIQLKSIWQQEHVPLTKKHPYLANGDKNKREVRIAPRNIHFSVGYAIYENKVRFISANRENFGFIIDSYEITEMMRNQFELIWNSSKPLNNQP